MKKVVLSLLTLACLHGFAQSGEDKKEEAKGGFKKERLFTGGSATAGFSGYSTILGITPQFGYSVTNWADLGVTFNLNYTSESGYETPGDRLRQTVYGPGAFVRVFPVNFLFATAQYEYNMIHLKYLPAAGSNYTVATDHASASSLLVGAGYAGGRYIGSNTYYFLSISWDVLGEKNSPYLDGFGNSLPVIRAGYNIGLFQGRRRTRYHD